MNMLSGLFNKEQMVFDTIQDTLNNVADELGCKHTDFFVMIKAKSDKYEPGFYIYQLMPNAGPKLIREMTIKEILGEEE